MAIKWSFLFIDLRKSDRRRYYCRQLQLIITMAVLSFSEQNPIYGWALAIKSVSSRYDSTKHSKALPRTG
jgi:hypothetical protein